MTEQKCLNQKGQCMDDFYEECNDCEYYHEEILRLTSEQHDELMQAIQTLPDDQRDTLMLKLEGGLSLEEIGTVTGVNRETVKSRLRYASNKLKLILEQ